MAAPTLEDFRARFPELSSTADALVEVTIDDARDIHDRRSLATLYCAAHLIALIPEQTGQVDGGSGVVASEGIGPQRVSYITQATGDDNARKAFFATTFYGRRFLLEEGRNPRTAIGATVVG